MFSAAKNDVVVAESRNGGIVGQSGSLFGPARDARYIHRSYTAGERRKVGDVTELIFTVSFIIREFFVNGSPSSA